jgi:hypothetical protein
MASASALRGGEKARAAFFFLSLRTVYIELTTAASRITQRYRYAIAEKWPGRRGSLICCPDQARLPARHTISLLLQSSSDQFIDIVFSAIASIITRGSRDKPVIA